MLISKGQTIRTSLHNSYVVMFFLLSCNGFIFPYKRVFLYLLIIVSMKYKQLYNRRFYALKYDIALQGFIFTSNGFLVCCSIVILIINKVLSIVMFEPFKVVGVVVCAGATK